MIWRWPLRQAQHKAVSPSLSVWCKRAPRNDKVSIIYEPVHEIPNNVACATSKASDQPAHMHSLIRAFASRLNIL